MVTSRLTPLRRGADGHGPISPLGRERAYGCTHLFSLIGREKVDMTSAPWEEKRGEAKVKVVMPEARVKVVMPHTFHCLGRGGQVAMLTRRRRWTWPLLSGRRHG